MTDSTTSPVLSAFDWQESDVGTLRHRSCFRFPKIEGENLDYEEMFTVVSILEKRFLEVVSTKCYDKMLTETSFREFSLSPSDIVLVVPFHEQAIANEAKHD